MNRSWVAAPLAYATGRGLTAASLTVGGFSKRGGPSEFKGYRGSIRGLYRAPLRDYVGVILRNTQLVWEQDVEV